MLQHLQSLGDHFRLQGECTGHLIGGNLSPSKCSPTWTGGTHFQTNWWRSAWLVNTERQNIAALGSLRWWAQQLCDESLFNKGLKSTGCILVIFLYKNVTGCLCHSAIKLQVHYHLLRSFWIYNCTLWGSGWTLNANSQCKFQFNVNVDDRVAADIFAIFTKLSQTAHGYNNFGCATVTKHCFY